MASKAKKDIKIGIIGAGPAGLCMAWFLKKKGYKLVTVLEKQNQVGGLSRTFNFEGKAFDIGANYMTPAYRTILKMAKEVGAEVYTEHSPTVINPDTGKYCTVLQMVRGGIPMFRFFLLCLKYIWLRWRLNGVLPKAGFEGLAKHHPELMVDFETWLRVNGILDLRRIFEIPITMMGYGQLNEIAAPYALRYISVPTFRTMLLFGAGLPSRYPKRFIQGFQPFWQRISWQLDVIKGVNIQHIDRSNEGIEISATVKEQELNQFFDRQETFHFDHLIVCTPHSLDVLSQFLSLTKTENELFSKVVYNPFAISTFAVDPLPNNHRVFHIYPLNPSPKPSIFAHQFPENPLITFYTPLPFKPDMTIEQVKEEKQAVLDNARLMIHTIQTKARGGQDGYRSYDRWPYFPHVEVNEFASGFYDRLEAIQGENKTYYCGGLSNFELMEPIANYAEYMVNRYF